MNQKEYIIEKCQRLFLKYGVKNLTMDEIARKLGMSKKTIYQSFENKAMLVLESVKTHLAQETAQYQAISSTETHALEENIAMMTCMTEELQEFNSAIYFDMQKYYPDSFALFSEHRENVALKHIIDNLNRGMEQGLYRNDIKVEIVGRIFVYGVDLLFDQQLFPAKKYHFLELYGAFINYHLRGILTPKGLKYLEKSNRLKLLMA